VIRHIRTGAATGSMTVAEYLTAWIATGAA
jgi:hypothetical protein